MKHPKVLLLQGILSSYRIPTYKIIAENVDLTVAYTIKNELKGDLPFKVIHLPYKNIFNVYFHPGLNSLCEQYDVIIYLADLHYISFITLPFIKRKFKVIPWTIGIRASYTRRYDLKRPKSLVDYIYKKILVKSDSIIFYMKEPIKYWIKEGAILNEKFFVAHNTVQVDLSEEESSIQKDSILFIGTLYKEKKIDELIESYIIAKSSLQGLNFPKLHIIGEGPEKERILSLIKTSKLQDCIQIHGAIYDEKIIKSFFQKSLMCVSPDQAGLSVLKSMGYGVPYVTRKNAITGGEILNIQNNVTGFLYKTQDDLVNIIRKAYLEPKIFIEMGYKAKEYYLKNATPQNMAKGVIDAIHYAIDKKK